MYPDWRNLECVILQRVKPGNRMTPDPKCQKRLEVGDAGILWWRGPKTFLKNETSQPQSIPHGWRITSYWTWRGPGGNCESLEGTASSQTLLQLVGQGGVTENGRIKGKCTHCVPSSLAHFPHRIPKLLTAGVKIFLSMKTEKSEENRNRYWYLHVPTENTCPQLKCTSQ